MDFEYIISFPDHKWRTAERVAYHTIHPWEDSYATLANAVIEEGSDHNSLASDSEDAYLIDFSCIIYVLIELFVFKVWTGPSTPARLRLIIENQ